jgi:hypothetical protein
MTYEQYLERKQQREYSGDKTLRRFERELEVFLVKIAIQPEGGWLREIYFDHGGLRVVSDHGELCVKADTEPYRELTRKMLRNCVQFEISKLCDALEATDEQDWVALDKTGKEIGKLAGTMETLKHWDIDGVTHYCDGHSDPVVKVEMSHTRDSSTVYKTIGLQDNDVLYKVFQSIHDDVVKGKLQMTLLNISTAKE